MSDEKDNVIKFGKEGTGTKVDNIISILQQLAGKEYVFAFYDADGIPNIIPSEDLDIKDLIFLAELIKVAGLNAMGMRELE